MPSAAMTVSCARSAAIGETMEEFRFFNFALAR